jgi:tetratricopeptide (TPR) repeat protein
LSKIRLALIAEESKTPEEILPMYEVPLDEEGKQQISDGIDLVLLAKAMFLERHNDLEQAIKTVATVPALKHDQFSNTFVANLFLKRAVQEGAAGYAKEEEKLLDSAMKFFQRALETSQCSFQSVLGVACVLAHRNRKWQALELLKSLADVKGGRPEDDAAVQINLGHLAMESAAADSDASKRAAKCYEAALRLLGDHPSVEQVKLFLAAAYFTSDRFEEALELLPSDSENPVVKFDRAVLLENHAAKILMDKQKAQSVDLVRKAIDMLAEAVAIFESFNKVEVSKGGFGTCVKAKLAEHIDYCRNTVPQAENWFAVRRAQIEEEKLRKQQLEQARKEREEIERQRLLEQQAREQEEAEQLAAQAEQRMQDIKESLAAAMVEDAEGPDGKKKRKKVTGEKGETKTKRKRGRAKKKSDSSSDSSSSSSSSSSGSSSDSDSSSSSGSSSSSSSGSSSSSSTSKSSGPVARPKHDTTMEDLFGEEAL